MIRDQPQDGLSGFNVENLKTNNFKVYRPWQESKFGGSLPSQRM